jgi:hypothetical protein
MIMLSSKDEGMIAMHKAGYKILEGKLYNPKGTPLKGGLSWDGYPTINYRHKGIVLKIKIHRLHAYAMFGDKMFEEGIQVRHLDNDKLNFKQDNLTLGTQDENAMDTTYTKRVGRAKKGGDKEHVNNHTQVIEFSKTGATASEIMSKFGIKSRSTVTHILRHSVAAKKINLAVS